MSFLSVAWFKQILPTIGYFGITIIVFAESGLLVGFFLPGDSLLFTAGFLASQGVFDIHLLTVCACIAAVVGDSVGYSFGKRIGRRMFKKENSLFFHKDHLQRARLFYEKHGKKTIILARFLPIIRTFAPIIAGIGVMEYKTFFTFNVVGGTLWAIGLTFGGFFLGHLIPDIDRYLIPIIGAIILVSILPHCFHIMKNKNHRRQLINLLKKPFHKP